jgi:inorganic pyrophosphatase
MTPSTTLHPWHGISPGQNVPGTVQAVVEIPKGSRAKFEIDKASGLIRLDRVLASSVIFPAHYGIIPQTYYDDGDPLDILVLCSVDVPPLTLIECRVIGVMRMKDNTELDDKILAVPLKDKAYNHLMNIDDIIEAQRQEISQFFTDYKKLENRTVEVSGFQSRDVALELITKSLRLYTEKFG